MDVRAILFQFPDDKSARLAFETLEELGYDPQLHEGGRLHIHVEGEDLTTALEIVQSHGGEWVDQGPARVEDVSSSVCGPDWIPIPAHLVNEDWAWRAGGPGSELAEEGPVENRTLKPDPGEYDSFEAR